MDKKPENKDKIKDRQAEYYQKNKDKIKDGQAEYQQKNKDKIKEYREKNKDKISDRKAEYYQKNKDKIKEYREKNKDKIKAKDKKDREIKKKKTYSSGEAFLRNLVYMKRSNSKSKSFKQKYPLKIFNLTYEQVLDIYNKQERKCFYSGLPFVVEKNHPMSISIDRIDSNKGYTIDNIALCVIAINIMKIDFPYKDLIPIFKAAIKHYKNI